MSRTLLAVAVGLAFLGLALGLVARTRHAGSALARKQLTAGLLLPIAIIVGTLPQLIAGVSEQIRIAASIGSLLISAASLTFTLQTLRRKS